MNGITEVHIAMAGVVIIIILIFNVLVLRRKLTISVVIYAILAVFNHPVARARIWGEFKRKKLPLALLTDRSVVPINPHSELPRPVF